MFAILVETLLFWDVLQVFADEINYYLFAGGCTCNSYVANCVVLTAVTSVKMNVTVMDSFSYIVEEYVSKSEVWEEALLVEEVGLLCWSSGEVSGGRNQGSPRICCRLSLSIASVLQRWFCVLWMLV